MLRTSWSGPWCCCCRRNAQWLWALISWANATPHAAFPQQGFCFGPGPLLRAPRVRQTLALALCVRKQGVCKLSPLANSQSTVQDSQTCQYESESSEFSVSIIPEACAPSCPLPTFRSCTVLLLRQAGSWTGRGSPAGTSHLGARHAKTRKIQ